MNTLTRILLFCMLFFAAGRSTGQKVQTPIMGWASWNNYRIHIDDKIIKGQAKAMVSSGMKAAGYQFVNIDDGYFGGRDTKGNIISHPKKFPSGMKELATYIHKQGLKAGIYSDAGINTCGSYYDKDTIGLGSGLFGNEQKDLNQMLNIWGFDFIKIDWCGGEKLELNEQQTYTNLSRIIYKLKPNALYNVCRWKFPGPWVTSIADSWRISGDIRNTFKSVMGIVDINSELWKYAGPGHVNDMDMLQVGRGMTYEEDKSHFSMWCMLASPLLAGNDLTKMSKQTIDILTNKELIAIDQDPLVYQARRIIDLGDLEVWGRPLISTTSGKIAVALLNRSDIKAEIKFSLDGVGIDFKKGYVMKDAWSAKTYPVSIEQEKSFSVEPHGVVVLLISGTSKAYNVFQAK